MSITKHIGGMIDRDAVKLIEEHIVGERGIQIIKCEHTNDYTTPKVTMRCHRCKTVGRFKLDQFVPLSTEIVTCPICKNEALIAHMNLHLN